VQDRRVIDVGVTDFDGHQFMAFHFEAQVRERFGNPDVPLKQPEPLYGDHTGTGLRDLLDQRIGFEQ